MDKIKVVIAEDHKIVRSGLRRILEENQIDVVGEVKNGNEAIELSCRLKPDVVLMDIGMPEEDGISATKIIKKKCPEIKIVVLTMYKDEEILMRAIKAGAIGYVLKERTPDELVHSIKSAYRGESVISPLLANRLLQEFYHELETEDASKLRIKKLTNREKEVLELISKGKTNREIASELCISENTVKNHLSHIFKKLHATDRTKAAIIALKKGLNL